MPLIINGTLSRKEEGEPPRIIVDSVEELVQTLPSQINTAFLFLNECDISQTALQAIHSKLAGNPGETQITICCTTNDKHYAFIDTDCKVNFTFELMKELQAILGEKNVRLKGKFFRNEAKPRRFFKKENADGEPAEKK